MDEKNDDRFLVYIKNTVMGTIQTSMREPVFIAIKMPGKDCFVSFNLKQKTKSSPAPSVCVGTRGCLLEGEW